MRWRGRRTSSNVEDRRGAGPAAQGGGGTGGFRLPMGIPSGGGGSGGGSMGMGGIILIVLVLGGLWLAGINPLELLGGGGAGTTTSQPGLMGAPTDDPGEFVSVVLADTEDTWNRVFASDGRDYPEPRLVLFTGSVSSACGFASAAVGPFYCPADQQVYIDLDFFAELRSQFDAPGDFAEAYVIAHEVGHHVQNVLGTMGRVGQESNETSIRIELQADCFAGIWAADAQRQGYLEIGDMDEAINAASQIGDDAIQMRTQGYVVPESFNHGTSEQRQRWFRRGFEAQALDACDTFSATTL